MTFEGSACFAASRGTVSEKGRKNKKNVDFVRQICYTIAERQYKENKQYETASGRLV